MAHMTEKEYLGEFQSLLDALSTKTTPFKHDTSAKKQARIKRARVDKLFFAATYFPHYITLQDGYQDVWKDPSAEIDWLKAGFAPFHADLFRIAGLNKTFSVVAGYRECAKSTLLGKIDVVHKIVFDTHWFTIIVAKTEVKAETKVAPIKIELESNQRLRSDFGDLVGKSQWEYGFIVTNSGRAVKGMGRDQSMRGEEINSHRVDHPLLDDISDPTKPDSHAVSQQFVESVKGGILKAVNSTSWSGLYLCNWTVKGDITDMIMTGKYTEHYNKVVIRALVPNEMETKEDRAIGAMCRDAGYETNLKSAWEFRHPTLDLLKEKKDDPETFDAEMMMRPKNRKNQKFKDHYFRYHTREELSQRLYVNYSGNDPSAKDAGDYKAVITVGLAARDDGRLHIPVRRAFIQQCSIDEMLVDGGYRQNTEFRPKVFGLETDGFQILVKREYLRIMKKYGPLPIVEVPTKGESKESRIERLVPFVKEGIITFDPDDPDQELLMAQLKAFPNGGEVPKGGLGDDGPDALEMALRLIQDFPHYGESQYESVQKREAVFEDGAY